MAPLTLSPALLFSLICSSLALTCKCSRPLIRAKKWTRSKDDSVHCKMRGGGEEGEGEEETSQWKGQAKRPSKSSLLRKKCLSLFSLILYAPRCKWWECFFADLPAVCHLNCQGWVICDFCVTSSEHVLRWQQQPTASEESKSMSRSMPRQTERERERSKGREQRGKWVRSARRNMWRDGSRKRR